MESSRTAPKGNQAALGEVDQELDRHRGVLEQSDEDRSDEHAQTTAGLKALADTQSDMTDSIATVSSSFGSYHIKLREWMDIAFESSRDNQEVIARAHDRLERHEAGLAAMGMLRNDLLIVGDPEVAYQATRLELERALATEDRDAVQDAYVQVIERAAAAGRTDDAERHIYDLIDLIGTTPQTTYLLGRVRMDQGREDEAHRLFLAAADAGWQEACDDAADCYFEGVGTVRDVDAAFRYYSLCSSSDDAFAALRTCLRTLL